MDILNLQKNWDNLGKNDSLWSILTLPDKKGKKWHVDEFFESGEKQIKEVMQYVDSLNIMINRRRALDFGCGVGRLTLPLSYYFDEVCGVDIAPSMIELAKKYSHRGEKCKYFLNDVNDLKLFLDNSFDFIYSDITLQHMRPRYSKDYIKEFLRLLSPHGLLIFQLPSHPLSFTKKLILLIKRIIPTPLLDLYRKVIYGDQPIMEMYGIKPEEVAELLEGNEGKILDIIPDQRTAPNWTPTWVSYIYCVTKE